MEEERRLAYVGITRARQKLVVSHAESRRPPGQEHLGQPSRFLREIPGVLLHDIRPKPAPPAAVRAFQQRAPSWSRGHAAVEAAPGIGLGQNVVHEKFGAGVVTDIEGSGAHARVHVNFEQVGSKVLVLAYAGLQLG